MVEVAQSYEMVLNFKAFVTFAMKNWKFCSSWSKHYEFAYVGPAKFF